MKQSIIFFGSGWFVIPVVEKLKDHGLKLVVTNEAHGKLIEFCREENIPYISSQLKDSETIEKIKKLNPTIAILASYGAFIPDEIINIFPEGIINIHPSFLPRWKGPSPVQYSLLNGDTHTGVTLIRLDNEIDHGPILSQKQYELQGNETSQDLLSILFEIGAKMVEELIKKLENNETLTETLQDHNKETWSYKINKKDGFIDINSSNIENLTSKIRNMIRAYYPWPGVWLRYSPDVIPGPDQESKLNNKIIKLLPENKIQVEGKNPMTYKDFINGFGDKAKELLSKLNLI